MLETASAVRNGDMGRVVQAVLKALLVVSVLFPYGLLISLSLGSGWTFPSLLPDRLDLAPWKHFVSDRDDLRVAVATSAAMSVTVATLATCSGLLIGRFVRRSGFGLWRFAIYLPFVTSPVVAGVCLYDLLVRLQLVSTVPGVVLAQTVFATAFASVFFSELWSPRVDRLEHLVSNLGGGYWQIWRHAVIPQMSGLIVICLLQTALFSWLDYGLASVLGGGHVSTVTTKLFSYIREASINQAAQSGLILLTPALTGFFATAVLFSTLSRRHDMNKEEGRR